MRFWEFFKSLEYPGCPCNRLKKEWNRYELENQDKDNSNKSSDAKETKEYKK